MKVIRIPNPLFHSNSYLIYGDHSDAIIIDPGDPSPDIIMNSLKQNNKILRAVFLTHEHFDHIAGVDALSEFFDFQLYCSPDCSRSIQDSKANMSYYMDDILPFIVKKETLDIEDCTALEIAGLNCSFSHTPGHSPGGMCIGINNLFFTGDTFLNNTKTPLNLLGSNKVHYLQSIDKLKLIIAPGAIIYPGHGEEFELQGKINWSSIFK